MADKETDKPIDNRRTRGGSTPAPTPDPAAPVPTPNPVAATAEETPDNHVYVKLQQGTYRFTPDRWLEVVERAAKKGRGYDPNVAAERVDEVPEAGVRKINATKWREPDYLKELERLRSTK